MTVVVDASLVVAALLDDGAVGRWADHVLAEHDLIAPHHLPVEVTDVVRRTVRSGDVAADTASMALRDLHLLSLRHLPFEPFAERIWQLRENVSAYDAWYVAVAEAFGCPLATIDARLARATGPRCEFLTQPSS